MKRVCLSLCVFLFLMCSCRREVSVFFEEKEEIFIYALEDSTNRLKEISVDYKIENEVDLFCLYTIYQNSIPMGFSSPASPNVSLIKSSVVNSEVNYFVDNYIFLCDVPLFYEVLAKTGKQFGFEKIHIFFNDSSLI